MEDLTKSLESRTDNWDRAKKFSFEIKANALQQLVLQRFQSLTTISIIGFAVVGVLISLRPDLIKNQNLATVSFLLLIIVALVGLGRHIILVRSDIETIAKKIKELPNQDWSIPFEDEGFKSDYWPEALYTLLVIGIILFFISLI